MRLTMDLRIKTLLLLSLILLVPLFAGTVEGLKENNKANQHSLREEVNGMMMSVRKLAMLDAVLDYDDAGANTKHDPKKRPGNGGRP